MNFRILIVPAALALGSITMGALIQSAPQSDESTLPLPEFMGHVMQRNAVQLWKWTELEVDDKGEHSGRPKTEEEWEDTESDALTIQQLTYVLQRGPLRVDDQRWDKHLADLRAAVTASAAAAEKKDYEALEQAGNGVNKQCIACHLTFAPELEAPPPPFPGI